MFGIPGNILIFQIFTGLVLGMIFVLLAIGLSLIFGLLTVVNFAHGAFYMWGAYVALLSAGYFNNFWLGLIVVPLVTGAIGMAVEYLFVRRLYGLNPDYPLLLTFGLSLIMIEAIRILFGTTGYPFNAPISLQQSINFFNLFSFPLYRIFVIFVTAAVIFLIWLFLEKTNVGLIIRGGTRDSEMVRVLGIDISKVWLVVFGIGTGLAGLAGILAAPMRGVYPEMGIAMLVECFVVTVVGGMGSLKGAVVSGLLLGQVVSLTSLLMPEMSNIVIFIAMAVVLLIRPSGLFGISGLLE
ncbi:MAG TPA: branched-chain amino acid ABC transporter permease [Thermodesulfobacteriota bacterium]|nr:branched-chain amino acid ABC transporter permease [Thermodesulfobacteriota bacterium]